MSLLITVVIAIGLSMDTFSVSLIYGTLGLNKNMQKLVSITVGLFHFFMPILGYQVGEIILTLIKVEPEIIVGIIFILLGIEMLLSIVKEEKVKSLTGIIACMLFAFTVSIDSFSVGIGFGIEKSGIILNCIIFALISGIFTYIGIYLGKKLKGTIGNYSTFAGASILVLLGIKYLV